MRGPFAGAFGGVASALTGSVGTLRTRLAWQVLCQSPSVVLQTVVECCAGLIEMARPGAGRV
ncbi:hypothetical protein EMIT043CA1_200077 [Pseudomonas brassicacearum]